MSDKLNKEYIGWIPTITGNLFFEYCHCSSNHSIKECDALQINQINNNFVRNIILSTTVDLRDSEIYDELEGTFRFILCGTVESNGHCFKGDVFLCKTEHSLNDSAFARNFNQILQNILDAKSDADSGKDIAEQYKKIHISLKKINSEIHNISFNVNELGFAIICNARCNEQYSALENKALCRQAFYLIKDSLHEHKHHSKDDDSLTTIHEFSDFSTIGERMINDLKRVLLSSKLKFVKEKRKRIIKYEGIIAYTKSLVESCYLEGFLEKEEYEKEIAYLNNFSESLHAIIDAYRKETQDKEEISNIFRSIIIFVLAIFTPILLIFKDNIFEKIPKNTNMEVFILFFANIYSNFLYLTAFWFVIFFATFAYIKKGRIKIRDSVIRRKSIQRYLSKPEKIYSFFNVVANISLGILIVLLINRFFV